MEVTNYLLSGMILQVLEDTDIYQHLQVGVPIKKPDGEFLPPFSNRLTHPFEGVGIYNLMFEFD